MTGLFYGMFRSEVKKTGSAKSSVTLEAFHCLQVSDIPCVGSRGTRRLGDEKLVGTVCV